MKILGLPLPTLALLILMSYAVGTIVLWGDPKTIELCNCEPFSSVIMTSLLIGIGFPMAYGLVRLEVWEESRKAIKN